MRFTKDEDAFHPTYGLGAWVLLLSAAVVLIALAFEYLGGYKPCPLCLQQRYAYYAAIPLSFVALIFLSGDFVRIAGFLFLAVALAYLANAGLGAYHAGIEWGFWDGPATCAGAAAPPGSAEALMKDLEGETGVRCDEAQWRLFGLSFAGWNVVASLFLSWMALKAALSATEQRTALVA